MKIVFVKKLKFKTIIGLLDFERTKTQKISVDIKLGANEFIDYAIVCEEIQSIFNEEQFYKVEDALDFFNEFYKKKFTSLSYFYMSITKLDIIKNAKVGVELQANY